MTLFNGFSKNGGLMDVIRCDESSYLIWKWHPKGSEHGNNYKENGIRWGSSLHVRDGEVAVFVYSQPNGTTQEFIEGPIDATLETKNLPIISNLIGLAYNGDTPFQAEVYFINLTNIIQIKFGVPYFDVFDPRFTDFSVPVAVRGSLNFKIDNYQEFVRLHRLAEFDLEKFKNQIRDAITIHIKDVINNAPAKNNIPVIQLESKISLLNEEIEYKIKNRLEEEFCVCVSSLDISAIEINKNCQEYKDLMNVTKNLDSNIFRAKNKANIKNILNTQKADSENYRKSLKIQREETQYSARKKAQFENFVAYKNEILNSKNNLNNKSEKNSSLNSKSLIDKSLEIGNSLSKNISGIFSNVSSKNKNNQDANIPPIPSENISYYVAIDEKPIGPFKKSEIEKMIEDNKITLDTLLWKKGMNNWKKVKDIDDFKCIEDSIPPIPKL